MLKTFSIGGIHPADHKLTAKSPIKTLPVPERIVIPLTQHIGTPAEPLVQKGDRVKTGQLIAKASGFMSAAIHAPATGIVEKIDDALDASGYKRKAIIIKTEADEWMEAIDQSSAINTTITLTAEQMLQRIAEAGITGMGGATFPTHIKLVPPVGKQCDTLIVNGVECEPYLTADHRVMIERSDELMIGICILKKILGADSAIIGIENNKPDAIKQLSKIAQEYPGISVVPLKVQYPQGGEKQLIDACLGRQVPSGKLPIEVGAVVQNVGTVFAIYEAVQKHKPLIERVVTVTGKSLTKPGNYLVRIGTPVKTVIEAAGGLPDDTGKVIGGGPMMGKALASLDIPITKGSSGILVMPADESTRKPEQNCIRCAKCVTVCPMGLSPYLLMVLSKKEMWDRSEEERIMDCIECGSCSYTCPAHRPLLDYIRLGKNKVGQIIRSRTR